MMDCARSGLPHPHTRKQRYEHPSSQATRRVDRRPPRRPPRACASASPIAVRARARRLTLAPLFGDHAVLQRGQARSRVGHRRARRTRSRSPSTGRRRRRHGGPGRALEGPHRALSASADAARPRRRRQTSAVTLHDVVVGDVWLCSGQSNMEFTVDDGGDHVPRRPTRMPRSPPANFPLIRQLQGRARGRHVAGAHGEDRRWQAASPVDGREVHGRRLFLRPRHPPRGRRADRHHRQPLGRHPDRVLDERRGPELDLDRRRPRCTLEEGQERVAAGTGGPVSGRDGRVEQGGAGRGQERRTPRTCSPGRSRPPPTDSPALPGGLFNAMIAPLQPGAIRGILWYQGEANVGHPASTPSFSRR